MGSMVATVDPLQALVRLDIDMSDLVPTAPYLTVTRTPVGSSVASAVRPAGALVNGLAVPVLGQLVLYDTEMPLDTAVSYAASYSGTPPAGLIQNPGFENGQVTSWSGFNGATPAPSQAQIRAGTAGYWAFRLTPDGVTANPQALSEQTPVLPGNQYTVGGWAFVTTAFTCILGINWFTSGHAYISTSSTSTALGAATWTQYVATAFTAPTNAAFAQVIFQMTGTPLAANVAYLDDVTLSGPVAGAVASNTVTVQAGTRGWLRDPTRPANQVALDTVRATRQANRRQAGTGVAYLGISGKTFNVMGQVFDPNNSSLPVGTVRQRRAPAFELRALARSFPDRAAMDTLLAPGSALLLQLPGVYGEPDRYLLPGNVTGDVPVINDQRIQPRGYVLPVQQVAVQAGPALGVPGARMVDLGAKALTWGALQASGGGAYDSFARTVAAGSWGSPDVGTAWALTGTAADWSTNGSAGQVAVSAVNSLRRAATTSQQNPEQLLTVVPPVIALGAGYRVGVMARSVDASNLYALGVEFGLAGATTIYALKLVAGVETVIASVAGPTYAAGQTWYIRAKLAGTALSVSAWPASTVEPANWSLSTTDASFAASNASGVYLLLRTGNTNVLPVTVSVDDYQLLGTSAPTWQQVADGVTT